jgi:4-carboxymuconolactone decarboxylase
MTKNIEEQFNKLIAPFYTDVNNHCSKHLNNDRKLIPIIASITQGITVSLAEQIEQALAANIAPEIILEMVYQLTPVMGRLKVEQALKIITEVFAQHQIKLAKPQVKLDSNFGAKTQAQIYGTEIKQLLKDLPDEAGNFIPQALTNHFFNDFYNRGILSVRDRERYELLALITLNVEFQIKAHARGSLKAGNSESELIWSVIQLLPYIGFPFVINSVQIIHQAAKELAD